MKRLLELLGIYRDQPKKRFRFQFALPLEEEVRKAFAKRYGATMPSSEIDNLRGLIVKDIQARFQLDSPRIEFRGDKIQVTATFDDPQSAMLFKLKYGGELV